MRQQFEINSRHVLQTKAKLDDDVKVLSAERIRMESTRIGACQEMTKIKKQVAEEKMNLFHIKKQIVKQSSKLANVLRLSGAIVPTAVPTAVQTTVPTAVPTVVPTMTSSDHLTTSGGDGGDVTTVFHHTTPIHTHPIPIPTPTPTPTLTSMHVITNTINDQAMCHKEVDENEPDPFSFMSKRYLIADYKFDSKLTPPVHPE